ncbi:hypothetical protein P3X46_019648 [Hevea brasiliensis]|uniref:Plant PDR ABC transporter associated domain-containing protein n=1 Tax=Hevea brasiliensis TaxID=3981 RepID=A0ABQ9LJD3_HEVBR|nr:uncharacterized protein LOC110663805 [Hevea brasiliensis]KAJ9168076.1 hypothetical protein P3X46_019648 [Hevea brasiliensis]
MNVLDSPLEALAINYVSFGIFTVVNNLWTWVALITAVVSFWKIRNAGVAGASTFSLKSEQLSSANCIDVRNVNEPKPVVETSVPESAIQPPPSPPPSSASPATFSSVFEDDGVTRGKFVKYYVDERESDDNGDDELTVVGEWGYGNRGCGEWSESWERVLRMRTGDMGWYMYQDLTAINGNVVRLWDGIRRRRSQAVVYGNW